VVAATATMPIDAADVTASRSRGEGRRASAGLRSGLAAGLVDGLACGSTVDRAGVAGRGSPRSQLAQVTGDALMPARHGGGTVEKTSQTSGLHRRSIKEGCSKETHSEASTQTGEGRDVGRHPSDRSTS
jgi:hypothetical protein